MIPLFKVFMAPEAAPAVEKVLNSGYIGQGPKVEEIEGELRRVYDSPVDVLTVNSCTSAIDLSLHLLGIKAGDSIVTTAQTCTASITNMVNRGIRPVWADVDPITGLLNPKSVEKAVATQLRGGIQHAKAILAVNWAGTPCDYDALRKNGLPIIEDAAHSFGSVDRPRGDYVCFSHQAIKFLTNGDGGSMIVPAEQVERARLLRWFGLDRRSAASFRCAQNIKEAGYKYHLNDIAAAIGLANLPHVPGLVKKHQDNAAFYTAALKGLRGIELPPWNPASSYWLYTILVEKRDEFEPFMKQKGIDVSQVHARVDKHDAFARAAMGYPVPMFGLDVFSAHQVSIPVGWWLTTAERDQIADAVVAWSKSL